jgi:hypothetical protein
VAPPKLPSRNIIQHLISSGSRRYPTSVAAAFAASRRSPLRCVSTIREIFTHRVLPYLEIAAVPSRKSCLYPLPPLALLLSPEKSSTLRQCGSTIRELYTHRVLHNWLRRSLCVRFAPHSHLFPSPFCKLIIKYYRVGQPFVAKVKHTNGKVLFNTRADLNVTNPPDPYSGSASLAVDTTEGVAYLEFVVCYRSPIPLSPFPFPLYTYELFCYFRGCSPSSLRQANLIFFPFTSVRYLVGNYGCTLKWGNTTLSTPSTNCGEYRTGSGKNTYMFIVSVNTASGAGC